MRLISRATGLFLALVLAVIPVVFQAETAVAGDQEWTRIINAQISDQIQLQGNDLISFDVAADDETVWVASGNLVYKSSDAGTSFALPRTVAAGIVIIVVAVSPGYATDRSIFVATATNVYRSTDDGGTWNPFAGVDTTITPGNEVITSMSVARDTSGSIRIVVGTQDPDAGQYGEVWLYKAVTGTWTDRNVAVGGTFNNWEVIDVAFSPKYQSDGVVFAVVTADELAFPAVVVTQFSDNPWGASWFDSDPIGTAGTFTGGSLAFPADFDVINAGKQYCFVGLANTTDAQGDVSRINGRGPGSGFTTSKATDLGLNLKVQSVAYIGNVSGGILFAGLATSSSANVRRTTDILSNSPVWTAATKRPAGAEGILLRAATTGGIIWAATQGDGGGLYKSTDTASTFNGTPLLRATIDSISDFAVNPKNPGEIIAVTQSTASSSVWRTTNYGDSWVRILIDDTGASTIDRVKLSPTYDGDSTFYLADIGGTGIWKSTDQGRNFVRVSAVENITAWAVESGGALLTGHAGGVVRRSVTGGSTWIKSVTGTGSGDVLDLFINPKRASEVFAVSLTGVGIGQVYRSRNSTDSFIKLEGDLGAITTASLALVEGYGGRRFIVFVGTDTGIYRQETGRDLRWDKISGSASGYTIDNINSIVTYPTGTLSASTTNAGAGIYRTINPHRTDQITRWARIRGGLDGAGTSTRLLRAVTTDSGTTLYAVETSTGVDTIYRYSDNLSERILLGKPGSESFTSDTDRLTFTWEGIDLPEGAVYRTVVSYDDGFDQTLSGFGKSGAGVADTEGTSYRVTPSVGASIFEPGRTNFWYVEGRFADPSGDTITSPRGQHKVTTVIRGLGIDSFVIGQFSIGLARAVLVSPFGGPPTRGEDVPLTPVLQWQTVTGANRYELEVDTSASFFNPFVNLTDTGRLDATVYRIEKELEYSTTYYWRVRASTPGSMGDWSMAGGFTTVGRPVPPPVIQITTTPAPTVNIPEPGTPSWVWVVIVFGVLMVIVMLVLILRTRRA